MFHSAAVVGYARLPLARFGGGLSSLAATELGGRAIGAALDRGGVPRELVEYAVIGHALPAGLGQATARQAAFSAGIPLSVPAEGINKVCLSGMTAIARAASLIALGEYDIVVAGGMESMSNAPYVLDKARFGYRMGDGSLKDSMTFDGLTCPFDHKLMGLTTDEYQAASHAYARERQDEWAARSHARAASAWKNGAFEDEVVPVEVPQRKGEPVVVRQDEGIRADTDVEALARLKPAFSSEGTITAGNASPISDGACALVLTSTGKARELGLPVLATVKSWGATAGPLSLLPQPSNAIRKAAAKIGLDPSSFDLYELNEAFASVAMAGVDDLGISEDAVNVNGGAVALGHPLGCTGARITVTLINALRHRGGGIGAAALCGGGGQGDALIVEVA
ncbi:acetyl-CoA C-acyltransferase [Actinospica durhamensis]|uniref:Probable acetyl-CoA acetyltransferase n=1 Tax=Actinospica durhamensis TaxID=1508375 RepID=A0A941EN47_9ACTN|nr:acetyl-CoA C-acyltransferase [Actinospica durhamensis]MBR7833527.1 acetyl-CoA C-acyltransferase [Actinospica durhamensis]